MSISDTALLPHLETSGAYWIARHAFTERTLLNLRSKMSVLDFRTEAEVPICFYELQGNSEANSYVIIPKIPKSMLEFIMGRKIIFQPMMDETVRSAEYQLLRTPKEHQVALIDQMEKTLRTGRDKRVFLALLMGLGKTYCSANLVSRMKVRFLFVVYSAKLATQGFTSFCETIGPKGLFVLRSSRDLEELDPDKIQGIFCTQKMIQSCCEAYGTEKFLYLIHEKLGLSMKIVDEVDREVGTNYWLECFTNFKYSMYLTGTKYKNLKPDDAIFQMVYKSMPTFGQDIKPAPNKNVYLVNYNFSPSKSEYYKLQMMDESLFKTYYNDYIALKDLLLDYIMKTFYRSENSIISSVLEDGGSVIMYCGRIANCDNVKERLIKYHGIAEEDIGIYNSSINKNEKSIAETKPWILTTTDSMGRGYDNAKIRVLIFLEFHFGMSTYVQNISRVGRLEGKLGYVIQGIDHSFWKVIQNHQRKINDGVYEDHFLQTFMYTVPDSYYQHYICGYRPDREEAKTIQEKEKAKARSFSKCL